MTVIERIAIVTIWSIAFLASMDNYPISIFLTDARNKTLPIQILEYLKASPDPSIAAISSGLILLTIARRPHDRLEAFGGILGESKTMHVDPDERRFLGMLTPSSNTVLEPLTSAMLADLPQVSAHFGRFPVTEISMRDQALGQFDTEPMLEAATLLADAKVHSICWNGTSAGWLGFEQDVALCEKITERTGVPACSSVLALVEIFRASGVKRFGLVTPYLDEIQTRILKTFAGEGFVCGAERHLGDPGNFSFSEVPETTIAGMCREVAAEAELDAITVFCTNLKGATVAPALEAELGLPIYDTVATALWKSLKVAGVDPARVKAWGRLFQEIA